MITAFTNFTLPMPVTREEARSIFPSTDSRADAEAIYTDEWRAFVREKYGTDPTVTYFDSPVVVDNVTGQVLADA